MPLARLRAALPTAALSLLLLTGCTATDDGVAPASAAPVAAPPRWPHRDTLPAEMNV